MATSPIYNWPEPDNTDLVKNGALAIRTLGDAIDTTMATMTPKTILDAKGDLIAASAADTPARLAVGSNGDSLLADSTTATGLRWQGNYAAGKNRIINGDFNIWQRGASFTAAGYTADRYRLTLGVGNTVTVSQQAFTAGTAPVAGYEGTYFCRFARTVTAANSYFTQRIENVRTFANQTVTFSFWAKSGSSFSIAAGGIYAYQYFGSGGSSPVAASFNTSSQTFGTSWTRYSFTTTIPSVSGKTITDGSYLEISFEFLLGIGNVTLDTWGWQVEAGSVATPFQTASGGSPQAELAMCQRYYYRQSGTTDGGSFNVTGIGKSTTQVQGIFQIPVTMRIKPGSVDYALVGVSDATTATAVTSIALSGFGSNDKAVRLELDVASGLTQYRPYFANQYGAGTGYIGVSAEL